MIATESDRRCPWPGPQPYDEQDRAVFFGREREIREIRQRVESQRLCIVAGESGVGKTSLLRAGVVAALRETRRSGKGEPDAIQVPPVLLLSGWGGGGDGSVDGLFSSRLAKAIADLREHDPLDYELIAGVPPGETFFHHVVAICDQVGGLILVVDQFEEVLRAGKGMRHEALSILADLYRFEGRLRLVLSLREEYRKNLDMLDQYARNLLKRTYFVRRMRIEAVEEAIPQAAGAAGIVLDPAVVEELLDWLDTAAVHESEDGAGVQREPVDGPSVRDHREEVNLLTMQTILHELCQHAVERARPGSEEISISPDTLRSYRAGRRVRVIVNEALERWIDMALNETAKEPNVGADVPAEWLTGSVRQVAVQMAPSLSSGGYKLSAEQHDLMINVLGAEFRTLAPGVIRPRRDDWQPDPSSMELDATDLGLETDFSEVTASWVSGIALQSQWSPAKTASYLVRVFFETLARLKQGNIIKPIRIGDQTNWELVHDGLGDPFVNWADKKRLTWDYVRYAAVARRGEDIVLDETKRDEIFHDLCWWGCTIEPAGSRGSDAEAVESEEASGKQVFENVWFVDCDLKGTMFIDCVIRGGGFRNCNLDGVLFISSCLEAGPGGEPVTFEGCKGIGLSYYLGIRPDAAASMGDVLFTGACEFIQFELLGIALKGPIRFAADTSLFQAHFASLESEAGENGPGRIEFEPGCQLDFCAWDGSPGARFDISECDVHSSGPERP